MQDASERGSSAAEQKHANVLEKRTEEAIERAKERVKDETEGWDTGADDDGGNEKRLYTVGGVPLDV